MTRDRSLEVLGLSQFATRGEIEGAYKRLVRRYPPEFQPEKFRQIDEAYRFLTSLPYMLERLLSPGMEKETIDKNLIEKASIRIKPDKEDRLQKVAHTEKEIIREVIKKHPRNLDSAAKELGMSRTTLWRRMKKYNMISSVE